MTLKGMRKKGADLSNFGGHCFDWKMSKGKDKKNDILYINIILL